MGREMSLSSFFLSLSARSNRNSSLPSLACDALTEDSLPPLPSPAGRLSHGCKSPSPIPPFPQLILSHARAKRQSSSPFPLSLFLLSVGAQQTVFLQSDLGLARVRQARAPLLSPLSFFPSGKSSGGVPPSGRGLRPSFPPLFFSRCHHTPPPPPPPLLSALLGPALRRP